MAQTPAADRPRTFIPSLEGVRGYAFLLVFFAHSFVSNYPFHRWWLYPANILVESSMVAVPVFFVLSGFLICGILIDTRERQGYYKVFYIRRVLRVFPLYYVTLAAVAFFCVLNGYSLGHSFWRHFLYIHNLSRGYASFFAETPNALVAHLWSMGVEEQFYIVWPLVVWICPSRRILLRVTLALIGASCVLRFVYPWLRLDANLMYYWTPTRVDAILLGAVLAIIRRDAIYRRLEPLAKYVAVAGLVATIWTSAAWGTGLLGNPVAEAFCIPIWNLTAAGMVVAVMQQGSSLYRICSGNGICWLGARSYALYLFHLTYLGWFEGPVATRLAQIMPLRLATVVAVAAAFALTVFLAALCYRIIEQPAMNIKKLIRYGPRRNTEHVPQGVHSVTSFGVEEC